MRRPNPEDFFTYRAKVERLKPTSLRRNRDREATGSHGGKAVGRTPLARLAIPIRFCEASYFSSNEPFFKTSFPSTLMDTSSTQTAPLLE